MSTQNSAVYCVVVETASADGVAVEELLYGAGFTSFSSWSDAGADLTRCRIYCDSAEDAASTRARIEDMLDRSAVLSQECPLNIWEEEMQREDWAESWKQYFHTFKASDRLLVKPSWEDYEPGEGDEIVVEIDPGMSFGTGYHGTTKACLQFLDSLNRQLGPVSLLDCGCGSGILSIAAAKLGYAPVTAFDNDPQAVAVASENLRSAGCADVAISCHGLESLGAGAAYRVVVANILAPILIANAERLVAALDNHPESYLILSGIMVEQYPEVLKTFTALGVEETAQATIDEWRSGCFRKRRPGD